jgi:membrane-associated phospholipid phosphatase
MITGVPTPNSPHSDSTLDAPLPTQSRGIRDLGRASLVAVVAWVIGFAAYVTLIGLPTKRSNVLLWVLLAILAIGASQFRRTVISLVRDWSPVLVAIVCYDLLRGLSDNGTRIAHIKPHYTFDKWLGGGVTPTEHLQHWFHATASVQWYDYAGWAIYTSHFLVPWGVAVVLWAVASTRFRPYLYGLALLSWMALATYYLYPAKPPWMIAQEGLTKFDISRVVHGVWDHVGIERAARAFEPVDPVKKGAKSDYANPVAALPSLHGAIPMFIAIMLWSRTRWVNVILAAYPLAMGLTLVYAGEHFIFDVLMGWAYAAIAATVVTLLARRLRRPTLEEELAQEIARRSGSTTHASGASDTVASS